MIRLMWILSLLAVCAPIATAQDNSAAERQKLLKIMAQVEAAINAKDMTLAKTYLLPESVVTFQDTTVARGPQEIGAYFDRMLSGASSVLTGISVAAAADGPAIFYGDDMAVAYGHTTDTFEFRSGTTMNLRTAWSTTVVRQDGNWRIASLHFSNNLFDNPILNGARRMAIITAVAGAIGGALLMLILLRVLRRKG